jgi:hypothetical protein
MLAAPVRVVAFIAGMIGQGAQPGAGDPPRPGSVLSSPHGTIGP